MKTSEIILRVRNTAGDTNVMQFDDKTLIDWINDGTRECVLQNLLLQKSASQNTVVGVNSITPPTDILKLHSITFDNAIIKGMTLEEFNRSYPNPTDTGSPILYYTWASKIVLYPIPDSVKSLTLNYVREPTYVDRAAYVANTATDLVPDLPVGYHGRLVDYCLAQVAQQDGDNNLYQLKMQEFNTGNSQLKDHPEYNDDLYPFISVSTRDSGYDSAYPDGYYYG